MELREVMRGYRLMPELAKPHIQDVYRTLPKLPRGYNPLPSDDYCAEAVTAAAIEAGIVDAIWPECSAPEMYKHMTEVYDPKPNDLVFFDWNNDGGMNHVGVVYAVNGDTIRSEEGNVGGRMYLRVWNLSEYQAHYGKRAIRFCRPNEPEQPKAPAPAPADPNFYATVDELPEWAKLPISVMVQHGILQGDGKSLRIPKDETTLRTWVMLGRVLLFCATEPLTEGEA